MPSVGGLSSRWMALSGLAGPGRRAGQVDALRPGCFEFHDQRQILKLHEEKPFLVKLKRNGPSRKLLRKISPVML